MNRREFETALEGASSEHELLAWFGALLARESKLGRELLMVGGSAIEVYLTSEKYASEDIDIVGSKSSLIPVLKQWGFVEEPGRDHRMYWAKAEVGLVDLVGTLDKSSPPARPYPTPYGEVQLAPIEALIIRRLVRATRERSDGLFRQAEALALNYHRSLDWDYLATEARYEKVIPALGILKRRVTGR